VLIALVRSREKSIVCSCKPGGCCSVAPFDSLPQPVSPRQKSGHYNICRSQKGSHHTRRKEGVPGHRACCTMAMVSSSLGPINSLLDKLPTEPEFRDLRHALEGIRRHLLQFSVPGVQRTMRWMTQLREVAYDVEDWIDSLFIRSWGRFKLKWWWPSHQRTRIKEFTDQIRDMQDRAASRGGDRGGGQGPGPPYEPQNYTRNLNFD